MKKLTSCGVWGGHVKETVVKELQRYREGVGTVALRHVPAFECQDCGEVWFTWQSVKMMGAILQGRTQPTGEADIKVPCYDLAAMERVTR